MLNQYTQALYPLIQRLSDGRFHTLTELARHLPGNMAHIQQCLAQLPLTTDKHLGYRLSEGLEILDANIIQNSLLPSRLALIKQLLIFDSLSSTNQYLIQNSALGHGTVCFSEHQTAGRGRQGRVWLSPFGCNLYLSVLWELPKTTVSGLSLAIGIAIIRALSHSGISNVQLKWPNDVQYQGKKLAGILIELSGTTAHHCQAVIGIGLNLAMPLAMGATLDQPWTDITTISHKKLHRNQLAGLILDELLSLLPEFSQTGFAPLQAEWESYHAYAGYEVTLTLANEIQQGRVCGIDALGRLQVNCGGILKTFNSGEISVRLSI